MKTVVPDYYNKFKCIADKCRHTCCAGWEIDIDRDTMQKYEEMEGSLGRKLKNNIEFSDCPHFILKEDERCPFLNDRNLCEIIIEKGEAYLSQVCSDHPRFRNFFSDRVETGLGLCCEAAGKLILSHEEPAHLILKEDDGENEELSELEDYILRARELAFEIAQDRTIPLSERLLELAETFKVDIPQRSLKEWGKYLKTLARLDTSWDLELNKLTEEKQKPSPLLQFERSFEQLLVYFLFRHLPLAESENDVRTQVAFSLLSLYIIMSLAGIKERESSCSLDDLVEIARLYSSEIEYAEINTESILNMLWNEINA